MWIRHLVGLSTGLIISLSAYADVFPTSPLQKLTPGELCQQADSYRYPEQIAYCERDVDSDMKWDVIALYESNITGFSITPQNRNDYKIDHFIPLCMGGANEISNLWPQHMSVYKYTDSVELELCKKLELAEITQAQAIAQIKFAKHHFEDIQIFDDPTARLQYISENYDK